MLDVRRMRVLREVAVQGSFSAAAEALSFTQSAVSQQIAALERETGTILVQRSARGVRLTEAGEALVRHADAVLARLAEAEAELEAIAGLRGGRLRMAAFESAGATLMPLAIADFRAKHPAIELSMSLGEPEHVEPQLKSGELDLALGFGSRYNQEDGVERHFLLEDPMLLVLPKDCECNRLIYGACSAAGYDPRIAFETDDYAAVQGFVAAGVGVSLIAELGLTTIRDDILVRDLGRETPVRKIYAAVAGGYRTPATTAMLEVLQDVAESYQSRRPRLSLVG